MFESLLDTNKHLIGALEAAQAQPDATRLAELLDVRAALLRTLQEQGEPAPTSLRPLLQAQHERLEALLAQRSAEVGAQLERIERLAQAQAHYAPSSTRQVLRNGLNF